ncbi:hypothetical protein ACFL1B_00850 [Nanoarchaeota archaeon]
MQQRQEMSNILIPRMAPAEVFERLETYGIEKALRDCNEAGASPVFMHELADARIAAPTENYLWKNWFTTPSIVATGKTHSGTPVTVIAHLDNYLSNPDNIGEAKEEGLVNYAARIPQEQFQRLVDLNESTDTFGNRLVWLIDYEALQESKSGKVQTSSAMEHPLTIPFLGGETRATNYLKKHEEKFGKNIHIYHANDLKEEGPLGRLLFLGYNVLDGSNYLHFYYGRFLGLRAEGAAPDDKFPGEQIKQIIDEYVAPINRPALYKRLEQVLK